MRRVVILLPVMMVAIVAATLLLTSSQTRAVQNGVISLDMDQAGNTYVEGADVAPADGFPDAGTNHMTVGLVDPCLTTAVGNNAQHNHATHLIIQNVEDLIAWQVRLNYDGGQMRPSTFNATPFTDNFTGDVVGFANLPIDGGNHRGVIPASAIPAAAPGPQTALIGAVYNGAQNFPVSPDTPQKAPHDETNQTYGTTGGGILATLTLQVLAGNAGNPSLLMDLDVTPQPESGYTYFNGTGTTTVVTPVTQLGDGTHGEGAACLQVATPTPSPSPSPSPTLGPSASPTTPAGQTASPSPSPTPARTPTPRSPAALPPTGATTDAGSAAWAYLLLLSAGLAIPGSGAAFVMWRLRRNESG